MLINLNFTITVVLVSKQCSQDNSSY